MTKIALFSILSLFAVASQAQSGSLPTDKSYTELINLMSDCSGSWKFFSMMQDFAGNPATSKQMNELHNGASLAAQFLLQSENAARTGVPKKIGAFERYVVSRQDTTITKLMAYLEQEAFDSLEAEMAHCVDALELQESIIQMMRDSVYRN